VSPEEQVSPDFDWNKDLNHARREIEDASREAPSALAQALNSAYRMADLCQRAIPKSQPWQADSAVPPDWQDFLERISNDADSFYPAHLSLLVKGDGVALQNLFEEIAEAALDAQIQINAVSRLSPSGQKKAVMHLRKLMKNLRAAKAMLDPPPEGEVTGLRTAGNIQEEGGGEEEEEEEEEEEGEEGKRDGPPLAKSVLVPMVGRIAAGDPDLAEEAAEEIFTLPRQLVGGGDLFLLRVHGQSMTGAGIVEGDWIAIRRQPVAENGEIVVAMIDGDATVKKYTKSNGKIWLLPQNPDDGYEAIPGERAIIKGKVVAVFRKV
jgi:SOS regulatory protein LexA